MPDGIVEAPEAVVVEPEIVEPSGSDNGGRRTNLGRGHMTDEIAVGMAHDVLEGKTQYQIAEKYNYSKNNISRTLHSKRVKRVMRQELEARGIDEGRMAEKIDQLLEAKSTIVATYKGAITDKIEVPDNSNQRATLELLGDWMGISPYRKMHQEGGGPRVIIIGNPVFAQMFYGDEPGAGNALGSDRGSVEGIQSGADGEENLAVPEARDCD